MLRKIDPDVTSGDKKNFIYFAGQNRGVCYMRSLSDTVIVCSLRFLLNWIVRRCNGSFFMCGEEQMSFYGQAQLSFGSIVRN